MSGPSSRTVGAVCGSSGLAPRGVKWVWMIEWVSLGARRGGPVKVPESRARMEGRAGLSRECPDGEERGFRLEKN